MSNEMSVQ